MKTLLHAIFIYILTLIIYLPANSQGGNPFITNFQPLNIVNKTIYCIEHDENNIMFYGTSQGILVFNSENWDLIETPNSIFSLKYFPDNQCLYIGLKGGAGYIKKDQNGIYKYHSLSLENELNEDFNEIIIYDSTIVFKSAQTLIFINTSNNVIDDIWKPTGPFSLESMFFINNKLHIITTQHEMFIFSDDSLITLNISKIINNEHVLFAETYNDSSAFIGVGSGNLFLFDGKVLKSFEYEDFEYVNASIINDGIVLSDQQAIIISTLAGGIIIIDRNSGETKNIINYQSGLPDDEVFSLGYDHSGGIWVSHIYGVSRVDLKFPVEAYHSHPGLRGNIFSVYKNDTTLFVGTTEGLFFYAKEKHFNEEELIKIVKVKVPIKKETLVDKTTDETEENQEKAISEPGDEDKKSSGVFSKLFKRKSSKPDKEEEGIKNEKSGVEDTKQESFLTKVFSKETKNEAVASPEPSKELSYTIQRKKIKEKIYKLQSVTYSYKKIPNFDEKVKEIIPYGDRLLLTTNVGLFAFNGNEIKPVIEDSYIKSVYLAKNEKCFVLSSKGLFELEYDKAEITLKIILPVDLNLINSIKMDGEGNIWLGSDGEIIFIEKENISNPETLWFKDINGPLVPIILNNGEVCIYNKGKIYTLNGDSLHQKIIFNNDNNTNIKIFSDHNENIWVTNSNLWKLFSSDITIQEFDIEKFLTVFNDINKIVVDHENNVWVIDEFNKIFKLNSNSLKNYINDFELIIHYFVSKKGLILPPRDIELSYNENFVEVKISAPFFVKYNSTEYSYNIQGLTDNWSKWIGTSVIPLPYLPSGKYTLQLRAKNIFGIISDIESVDLVILPPFWKKKIFYILVSVILILLIYFIIKYRERQLVRERQILEEKVSERTKEIENQKNKIEKQAMEITDSITYAQRIQEALLPSQDILKKNLNDYFILFMPRDIVSGDFYWAFSDRNRLFLAAADCTGHGVPGAFMSMLGITFFNDLIKKENLTDPAEILNRTRNKLIESLSYHDDLTESNDGMDVAFCTIDMRQMMIHYSGAYNPLYVIKKTDDDTISSLSFNKEKAITDNNNKILIQIDADRIPVSNSILNKERFKTHKVPYRKGDIFYIFSDGYADQYGGEKGRKYFTKNLKNKVLSICDEPFEVQKKLLKSEFEDWKGRFDQLDDVLIIGFRII